MNGDGCRLGRPREHVLRLQRDLGAIVMEAYATQVGLVGAIVVAVDAVVGAAGTVPGFLRSADVVPAGPVAEADVAHGDEEAAGVGTGEVADALVGTIAGSSTHC